MKAVMAVVGEAVLADAYFNGSVDALESAFVAFRVGKGDDQAAAELDRLLRTAAAIR